MNVTAAYSNSFTLFRENFLLFFTLAFAGIVAVTVIESLLFGIEYAVYGAPVTVENDVAIPGLNAGMLLWGLMSQVLLSALSAVLHLAAWDVMRGAHPQPNAYLNRSAQMILPLFFLSIVVGIIVGFGVILLIIPGIYLFGMFAVLVPIIVIEGRGWEAMMRCVELSRGRRWHIAGSFVGLLVLLIAIVIVSAAIMGAIGDSIGAVLIVNTVISSLIFAFFAIFTTEIYGQLVNSES
ncbi:hypothetical protein SAMN06273572_101309 [Monaibacterium marinum]|uniref:Glycerophosphoryl diester phosphodiesterase membrane domain-containing protein n=1 Tax=Pontivivens marinum TaxID=1690039 RepID=A0A2C9CMK2_9RHOB|nr:hypothetical protein [Monaibacterium marinum]SOH92462.1 hypothetical protein SAMN06273572_101309 [Monaibacterium marinum]